MLKNKKGTRIYGDEGKSVQNKLCRDFFYTEYPKFKFCSCLQSYEAQGELSEVRDEVEFLKLELDRKEQELDAVQQEARAMG